MGFHVAKAAMDEGHSVTLFLAGDGVQLMRDGAIDHLNGLGTGNLRELYDAVVSSGVKIFLSGMSAKSRGLGKTDDYLEGFEAIIDSRLLKKDHLQVLLTYLRNQIKRLKLDLAHFEKLGSYSMWESLLRG